MVVEIAEGDSGAVLVVDSLSIVSIRDAQVRAVADVGVIGGGRPAVRRGTGARRKESVVKEMRA